VATFAALLLSRFARAIPKEVFSMQIDRNPKRLWTTVGDLIVATVDAAREISGSESMAYYLTALVLSKRLQPCREVAIQTISRRRRTRRFHY
jgi:hypothetical protein